MASLQQGVDDYVALLQGSTALCSRRSAPATMSHAFATALQRGGYATDPHYAQQTATGDRRASAAAQLRAGRHRRSSS